MQPIKSHSRPFLVTLADFIPHAQHMLVMRFIAMAGYVVAGWRSRGL